MSSTDVSWAKKSLVAYRMSRTAAENVTWQTKGGKIATVHIRWCPIGRNPHSGILCPTTPGTRIDQDSALAASQTQMQNCMATDKTSTENTNMKTPQTPSITLLSCVTNHASTAARSPVPPPVPLLGQVVAFISLLDSVLLIDITLPQHRWATDDKSTNEHNLTVDNNSNNRM